VELEKCNSAVSFLQSGFWGAFKARFGWNPRSFLIEWNKGQVTPLLLLRRRLAFGISFAYVPWGPVPPDDFSGDDAERTLILEELAGALKRFLPMDTAFVRFDPPWFTEGAGTPPPVLSAPFTRSGADIQPPDTVILNLEKDAGELLSGMKPKWRYNIRLAEKKGIMVSEEGSAGLDIFYDLFRETGERDGIAVHAKDYYTSLFDLSREYRADKPVPRCYIARYEGEAIAAVITLFRREEATYLYGASSGSKRNLMAPYLLQWTAMLDAKKSGCMRYDLFGIPPNKDPSHPMAGLYLFKTGFGGKIIHRSGSWDYNYKPFAAFAFRSAEKIRKNFRSLKKHRKQV
jgi:lipid II:glycine glycyltransferase (peptidoglycan interpeptide bridge formation enzyme)